MVQCVLIYSVLVISILIVELQWLGHLWNHESMFETGVVRLMSVNHSARSGGLIGIFVFRFFKHEGMLPHWRRF